MATIEKIGLLTVKDDSDNQYLLYPVTKTEAVDGLDESLALKVNATDIVDNLESTSATLPLSANQGNVLRSKVDDINAELNGEGGSGMTLYDMVKALYEDGSTHGKIGELAASFSCNGRGYIVSLFDEEIGAGCALNFETRHFTVSGRSQIKIKLDGNYQLVKFFRPSGGGEGTGYVISNTTESLTANTVLNPEATWPNDTTANILVWLVIPLT